jgi:hypothetical protein
VLSLFVYEFKDDDAGYLAWVKKYRHGFVLNAARSPRSDYLVLHKSICHTITGKPTVGDRWTDQYIKICSMSRADLWNWANREAGGDVQPCAFCTP